MYNKLYHLVFKFTNLSHDYTRLFYCRYNSITVLKQGDGYQLNRLNKIKRYHNLKCRVNDISRENTTSCNDAKYL